MTQEELDDGAGTEYTSATLNADGSATYLMTVAQYSEMLNMLKQCVEEAMSDMTGSGTYSFDTVEANDSYTLFTIRLSADDLELADAYSVASLLVYASMYTIFSAGNPDNITVSIYNSNGELIETAGMSDLL